MVHGVHLKAQVQLEGRLACGQTWVEGCGWGRTVRTNRSAASSVACSEQSISVGGGTQRTNQQ